MEQECWVRLIFIEANNNRLSNDANDNLLCKSYLNLPWKPGLVDFEGGENVTLIQYAVPLPSTRVHWLICLALKVVLDLRSERLSENASRHTP